jgi:hypothetical protein
LQRKIKVYDDNDNRNINFPVRKTIEALKKEKKENRQYKKFYEYFIAELQEYKRLHDNNNSYIHVYENISMFSSCIYDLLQHVYTCYDNN